MATQKGAQHSGGRRLLSAAQRLVVKIGSRVIVRADGRPDARRMLMLTRDLARLHQEGRQVVLVSSGAIGAGIAALNLARRPDTLPELQMAAAVGQSRLMAHYTEWFGRSRCIVGQVLLTHDDLHHRARHLNARHTLLCLLRNRIVPIVNENDVVSVDEIRVGDNDHLAALVALLIGADALVLLTTADGLRRPQGKGNRTCRVSGIDTLTPETLSWVQRKSSALSTGGMASKLESARTAARAGIPVVIADGRKQHILASVFRGEDVGTLISAGQDAAMPVRKRWIAFFHRAAGTIHVDAGAAQALEKSGRSLLPIGVTGVSGHFSEGAAVNVRDPQGRLVARGLSDYSSADILKIRGKRTADLAAAADGGYYRAIIHRDNMTLLPMRAGEAP